MPTQVSNYESLSKWLVIITEFLLTSALIAIIWNIYGMTDLNKVLMVWVVSYVIAILFNQPVVQTRMVRSDQIATIVLKTTLLISIIFYVLLITLDLHRPHILSFIGLSATIFLLILSVRLLWRVAIKKSRFAGRDDCRLVFVGSGVNLSALYDNIATDVSMGYRVIGYFDDELAQCFQNKIPRLGGIDDVNQWLEQNKINMLFCNLPSRRSKQIVPIINYCENNLIQFFSVPNVTNYVHHKMHMQFIDSIPVLTLREEPIRSLGARFTKRTFDIVFSLLVIVLLLWWVTIIVAVITKITMPGPVMFRQKRNGRNNEEFQCLKFRTMVINNDADRVQATSGDPRVTRWGLFMRKTNIDELPQFINVLRGEMSVVGPRPHMLYHTEEYRHLIDKYMVRLYVKPGITGWAQVNGSRGETKTVDDMRERIHKDIWYIENWTFMLDIRIIVKTVINILGKEEGNAY